MLVQSGTAARVRLVQFAAGELNLGAVEWDNASGFGDGVGGGTSDRRWWCGLVTANVW